LLIIKILLKYHYVKTKTTYYWRTIH